MSEPGAKRHGLEPRIARFEASANPGLVVQVRPDTGHLNLRAAQTNRELIAAIEQALGQPLPAEPNTLTAGEHSVYWLGPDEWLVLTGMDALPTARDALAAAIGDRHAALNDVSGGQLLLHLSGSRCRDVLARGCTLDLHPRVFTAGRCAQSGLAKANVLIALRQEPAGFDIVVRRSFSDYLLKWLLHSGAAFGARVTTAGGAQ